MKRRKQREIVKLNMIYISHEERRRDFMKKEEDTPCEKKKNTACEKKKSLARW